jgi:hypothetical protein
MARPARVFLAAELLLGIAWFLLPDSPPRAVVYCTLGLAMVAAVVVETRLHRPSQPEKLGAFTLNRSGFPIVEVPLADPDARLLFILGDLAWSAIAVLAARRLVRPPGPLPPP